MSDLLNKAIVALEKKYGTGCVINFEDTQGDIEFLSSGSLGLDNALGGGYAKGRIIEIFGEESSGKSTLAIEACVNAQKEGMVAVYIDNENGFDRKYAKDLGVDFSRHKWLFSQPTTGEETFDIVEEFIRIKDVGIIVIDSVAVMTPKAELEGDFGDSKMGLHARLMSQGMRKLVSSIHKSDAIVIFINQQRDKIGVMWGDSKVTTGGNALKFYASQRLKIARTGTNKDGSESISNNVKVKVVKNKVAPPYREAEFQIVFGKGIDRFSEIINLAVELGIIKKSGSWFSYDQTKLGQGIESAKAILADNPELMDEITDLVKIKM